MFGVMNDGYRPESRTAAQVVLSCRESLSTWSRVRTVPRTVVPYERTPAMVPARLPMRGRAAILQRWSGRTT